MKINGPDRHHFSARQLLASADVSTAGRSRLAENLAHYNAQLSEPVEHVYELLDTRTRPDDDYRWLNKIRREVNKPYSDRQVGEKAQELDADFLTLLASDSRMPRQVHVTGGVTRGRFGANSDLDLLAEGLLSEAACRGLAQQSGWKVTQTVSPAGETVKQSVSSPSGVHADFLLPEYFEKLAGWYGNTYVVDTSAALAGETSWQDALEQSLRDKGLNSDEGFTLSGQATARPREAKVGPYPLNFEDGYQLIHYPSV